MAEAQPQLPWLYPYREDAQSTRLGEPVFRPFVPVSLVYGDQCTWSLTGLIDSGADAILASDLLTEQLGVDLKDHEGHTTHAVGGRVVIARYKTVGLRLHPRDADEQHYVEWQAQVGFIEGWHSDGLVLLGNVEAALFPHFSHIARGVCARRVWRRVVLALRSRAGSALLGVQSRKSSGRTSALTPARP